MFKSLILALLATLSLSACVVAPVAHERGAVGVMPLPLIVELGPDFHFYQHGYHYRYHRNDDRWRYAGSRSGPWSDLPRNYYPREIRYRDARGVIIAPPLPLVVELGPELYLYLGGFHYQYVHYDSRWRYAQSRSGPWWDLPRSHYPRDIRYRDGRGIVLAPPLPARVELGRGSYYQYRGYHYHYDNGRWRYANARSGPWAELPRNYYPRELRRQDDDDRRERGRGGERDDERERSRDRDRDRSGDWDRDRRSRY